MTTFERESKPDTVQRDVALLLQKGEVAGKLAVEVRNMALETGRSVFEVMETEGLWQI